MGREEEEGVEEKGRPMILCSAIWTIWPEQPGYDMQALERVRLQNLRRLFIFTKYSPSAKKVINWDFSVTMTIILPNKSGRKLSRMCAVYENRKVKYREER